MYFIFFIIIFNATQLLNNVQEKHQYIEISSLNCLLIRFVVCNDKWIRYSFNFFFEKRQACD